MKKWLGLFFTFLFLATASLFLFHKPVQAQELKKAITDVKVWDVNNGREATKKDDSYQLTQGVNYKFDLSFDLKEYDNKMKDGDTFKFTIPAPFTVAADQFELVDKATNIPIGDVVTVTNGAEKGAVVTVTLKNLKKYADAKNASSVEDVKGSFYIGFVANKIGNNQEITFKDDETSTPMKQKITVAERKASDYSGSIGIENLAKIGGVLSKTSYNSDALGKSGTYLHPWHVRLNARQETYNSPLVLKDTISNEGGPMQYIPETVKVVAGYYNPASFGMTKPKTLEAGKDYTITYNSSYTTFELTITNPASIMADNGKPAAFSVYYSTTSPTDGTTVGNSVSVSNDGNKIPSRVGHPGTDILVNRSSKVTDGGTISIDTTQRLVLYKRDELTGKVLAGAIFKVTTPSGQEVTLPATDSDGRTMSEQFSAEEIAKGDFTVTEVTAPKGYKKLDAPITVTVKKEGTIRIINNDKAQETDISVKKVWEDADNKEGLRPESVTVKLLANGAATDKTLTLNQDNNWQADFTQLAINDDNGQAIQYTVAEDTVANYEPAVISGDQENGYTITNKRTPETLTVAGTKTWDDANNQDGKRPEKITVNLLENGQKLDSKEVTAADNWAYSFDNLPKYKAGKEVSYTIDEDEVAGYTKEVKGNDLTNHYQPETLTISGTKTWDDANNQDGKRPEKITVNLLENGQKLGSKEVTAADNWTYSFDNLPKYKAGQEVTYSLTEEPIPGYEVKVDGYNITNTHTPETVDIEVSKNWDDANNQDGIRPSEIEVSLIADGDKDKAVDTKKITADANGKWTAKFEKVPKYKDGKEIKYSLIEKGVANYTSKIEDFTLTNSYKPATVDYKVTKKWDDANNQDGKRPDKIKVHLYKTVGNVESLVESRELSAANKTDDNTWETNFTNLPKNEAGKEISYSVKEDAVDGYTSNIQGSEITNSYTPEMITISGKKVWDDANNQDGKRPSKITVVIKNASNEVERIEVAPDAAGAWSFTSKPLPKYANGKEIDYQVTEEAVLEYDKTDISLTDTDSQGNKQYTITNKRTPAKKTVSGSKTWVDDDNKDGKRPSQVTIHLLKDGKDTGKTATLSAANGWKYEFTDLDSYENGKEIVYSISEDPIEGYENKIEGFNTRSVRLSASKSDKKADQSSANDGNDPEVDASTGRGSGSQKRILPRTGQAWSGLLEMVGLVLALGSATYYFKKKQA
ncbi:Cna B-type domain-containing protein [Streptococcus oricebi]|uniref:Collagen adhesin n=1 Tax=Streptococcus oricebi TaxID=1547447 RepID=A0ABS5B4Y8_9STRE|nr:Cna B-type domain-containing protein [Streptococcus oricebi]MBP2623879.1 hypothetical protein [Streptococcus oricebi]